MVSLVTILVSSLEPGVEKAALAADCDFLKTLAHNFPEVASLRKEAADGKVRVKALDDALSPYALGIKELPRVKQVGKDAGKAPTAGGTGRGQK